ncbi:MAG: hypothetical protein WB780_13675 [Candidatus Acidiferrales bacterium]
MKIQIKGGTLANGESLCENCKWSHIERGYRQSEERVTCKATYPEHTVRFRVRECSGYAEPKRQTLEQMEDIAWVLGTKGYTRKVGFVPAEELRKKDGEGIELILSDEE